MIKSMPEDLVSVIDLANRHGKRKQTIFKILRRLGIESKLRPGANNRGQLVAHITEQESQLVSAELRSALPETDDEDTVPEALFAEQGVFYLLLLEPDHDPGRFKVGFATNMPERLRQLRCSAPLAKIVLTWPCKRLWEKTAIDCVAEGCERLHTEVFRTASLDEVISKCKQFFSLMPQIESRKVRA